MKYALGIDLGTSYFKAGLFDSNGKLCGLGKVEVEKQASGKLRCELSSENFWKLLSLAVGEATNQAKAKMRDITAMSYSSQANSFILLDNNDSPLTPLILWPDERAETIFPEIQQIWDERDFIKRTGIGVDCGGRSCINKLMWFQKYQPQIWNKTRKILTISDYLVYSLTGKFVGDTGTASLLGILDVKKTKWNQNALGILNIEETVLAKPMRPAEIAGEISANHLADKLGLPSGIPIYLGSLDHYMAAVGAGLGQTAELSISLGTVVACINKTTNFLPKKNVCTGPSINDQYNQITVDSNGAIVLEWYNRKFCPEIDITQMIKLAEKVPADCDGLIAKPNANTYDGLQGFDNIKENHTCGHFARAIMQSTAETLKNLIDCLCNDRIPLNAAATGGGAKSDFWLKICSEKTGIDIFRADCPEPACKGAAIAVR